MTARHINQRVRPTYAKFILIGVGLSIGKVFFLCAVASRFFIRVWPITVIEVEAERQVFLVRHVETGLIYFDFLSLHGAFCAGNDEEMTYISNFEYFWELLM
jgi:hypothetical protein